MSNTRQAQNLAALNNLVVGLLFWNAAASGLDAETIVACLVRYGKYDVPGNILADVRDYISRFGRLKLHRADDGGLLLIADEPLLMLEVRRQRKVAHFIQEDLDDRSSRVNPAFRGHIKRRWWTSAIRPRISPVMRRARHCRSSCSRRCAATASRSASGTTSPTRWRDGTTWRVTPSSVTRARLRGLEPAVMLEKLRTAVSAALPAQLEAQIKAWSRHYGSASVQTLAILRFKDQATLDELLRDRVLRRLMEPFAPTARLGLAAADPDRLEELVAALGERGVEVVTEQAPRSASSR